MNRGVGLMGVVLLPLVLGACGDSRRGKKVADSGGGGGTGAGTLTTPGGFPAKDKRIDGADGMSPDPASEGVRVCALGSGEVVVVWSDDRDGTAAIWSNASADGGRTWPDTAVKVSDGDGGAVNPALACGTAAAYVVWEDQRDSEIEKANIYVARTDDAGQSWSANLRVGGADDGIFDRVEPAVAVDGNDVHVAWSSEENGAPDIYVASSGDRAASFSAPQRIDGGSAGTAWSRAPVIAAGDGDVVVAWEDRRNGTNDIFLAHSGNSGGSFSEAEKVDPGNDNSFSPVVVVADGEAYATWHDQVDGEFLEVYLAYSSNGGASWGASERISEGPAGERDSVLPKLALQDGVLHATWFQGMVGGYHVVYKRIEGGVPGSQVRVDHAPDLAQLTYPEIAASGSNVAIAWRDDRNASIEEREDLFYAFSSDGGQTWSATDLRIDSHEGGTTWTDGHQVFLDGTGLNTAWTDGRSGSSDVYFIHLELGDETD